MRKLPAMMIADGAVFAMMFDQTPKTSPINIGSASVTWSEDGGGMPLSFTNGFGGRYQHGNQSIVIPKQSAIMPTDYLTVEGVFTVPPSWAAWRGASCTEAGGWNFESLMSGPGEVRFVVYKVGTGYLYTSVPQSSMPPAGTIFHIAGVYDGTNAIVYLNGVEIQRSSTSGAAAIQYHSAAPLVIGAEAGASPTAPNYSSTLVGGLVSAFALYDTVLTPMQIAAHAALAQKNKVIGGYAVLDNGDPASRVLVRNSSTLFTVADVIPDPSTGEWSATVFDDYYDVMSFGPSGYRPVGDYPIQPV